MKAKAFLKGAALLVVLLVSCLSVQARSYDGNLIYNSEEKDGVMVGQTVYKMDNGSLANYMKYNYAYDADQRMIESETLKWSSTNNQWENDLRITYAYSGKSITTNYYKWNKKTHTYVLVPEMTATMDNPNL
ncbi:MULTISPECIES: DUF3836 domain-containing protein [Bacteroides]|uniref:DUF3836 domain-containing protein n=1 Tax=Bacteroides TaxID=816 RepID=UPI0004B15621|nr:DUF3836 domain-containing protein [Bacteroides neonati]MCP3893471.1 DUF3836 domain-containing protein [Bacteroides sp.]